MRSVPTPTPRPVIREPTTSTSGSRSPCSTTSSTPRSASACARRASGRIGTAKANLTPQRWKLGSLSVTVDFLLPPIPGAEDGGRLQPLERDLSALITPGLQLAQDERQEVLVDGYTLKGERVKRAIPVCGPATFLVLKSLAFHDRGEPKDAFDLVYVLRRWPGGIPDIVERIGAHIGTDPAIVGDAFTKLASNFESPESHGSLRAAEFDGEPGGDLDAGAADAHGYVDDLMRHCRSRGYLDSVGWLAVPDSSRPN
jgi:hypothetical protein